jgi:hypothetical protein
MQPGTLYGKGFTWVGLSLRIQMYHIGMALTHGAKDVIAQWLKGLAAHRVADLLEWENLFIVVVNTQMPRLIVRVGTKVNPCVFCNEPIKQ